MQNVTIKLGLVSIISISLFGCVDTQVMCIKIIDASSHAPIANVSTVWRKDVNDIGVHSIHEGPVTLTRTDRNGLIEIHDLHKGWQNRFIFTHPDYSTVYGLYEYKTGFNLATNISYLPPGPRHEEFILEGSLHFAERSNGCYLVLLQKHL